MTLPPNYKMIILCTQQTTNKPEERSVVMALERLDEVTTEFGWEPFQATAGEKNKDFCGKTQRGEEKPSRLKIQSPASATLSLFRKLKS